MAKVPFTKDPGKLDKQPVPQENKGGKSKAEKPRRNEENRLPAGRTDNRD